MSDEKTLFIGWESASDVTTGAPMVAMRWKHKAKLYPVDRVLATARDLFIAAAAAVSDAAVFETITDLLDTDERKAAVFMSECRTRRTALVEDAGAKPIFRIAAVYGYRTRRPLVAIHSGTLDAQLSVADACAEAARMITVATAADIDARFRYALGESGLDVVAIEDVFKTVRSLDRSPDSY